MVYRVKMKFHDRQKFCFWLKTSLGCKVRWNLVRHAVSNLVIHKLFIFKIFFSFIAAINEN